MSDTLDHTLPFIDLLLSATVHAAAKLGQAARVRCASPFASSDLAKSQERLMHCRHKARWRAGSSKLCEK